MLPKRHRISRVLSASLSQRGETRSNELFFLKMVPYEGSTRFGVSISKKIAKSAVVRNRLRRLGYRLLGKYVDRIKAGMLMRISWRKMPRDNSEAEEAMDKILNKFITK